MLIYFDSTSWRNTPSYQFRPSTLVTLLGPNFRANCLLEYDRHLHTLSTLFSNFDCWRSTFIVVRSPGTDAIDKCQFATRRIGPISYCQESVPPSIASAPHTTSEAFSECATCEGDNFVMTSLVHGIGRNNSLLATARPASSSNENLEFCRGP